MPPPWIDISVPLRPGMVHWPGDPEVVIERVSDLARGDVATVSRIDMSAHTGTHVDAPAHFLPGGAGVDALPIDAVVGRARVIEIVGRAAITARELRRHRIRRGERLLFKTRNSKRCWRTDTFVKEFVHLRADAARYLAERRVRAVGVDYLSIGAFDGDGVETHRLLLAAGVWIIEGLDLSRIAPGRVDLICLPLRLAGGDGAPARAIVRQVAAS